jgi:hypothetical protein
VRDQLVWRRSDLSPVGSQIVVRYDSKAVDLDGAAEVSITQIALRTAWIKGRDNAIVSVLIGLSAAFDQWVGLSRSPWCPRSVSPIRGAGMSSPIRTFLPADHARAAGRIRISSSPISLRSRRFVMFYRRRGDVTSETSASSPSDSYINVTIPLTLASILPPSPIGSLTGG